MAYRNRARMTTATTGTGAVTLGTAVVKYQTFAASGAIDQEEVYYAIEDGNAWEVGVGIYTAAGTTMTRVLIESSTAALLVLSGTAEVFLTAPATYLGRALKIETFTPGSYTWTKAAGAKRCMVACVGGGSGGGSGSKGAAGTVRVAGASGGGGGVSVFDFHADNLPATVSIVVGAAGVGATAVTVNSTAGANGGSGAASTFGTFLKAFGGTQISAGQGLTGGGNNGVSADGSGGNGNFGNALNGIGAGSGGSGGGVTAGNSPSYSGGVNSSSFFIQSATDTGGGQTAPSTNGVQGTDRAAGDWRGGWGGSGGGGSVTVNGGTGGKGGTPGGGGGGGGSAQDSIANSGAGGNGGDGRIVVVTYF